ncbi:unnamed protein product [Dracunculus medinensis]|uniref:DAO domain-containing protein n=1 Tax=Dracunculus medinensis TaxID=318479 RepID=A0A3P7P3M4_DRAME|nr:unnamed protein product [Dracunculus medinensis]
MQPIFSSGIPTGDAFAVIIGGGIAGTSVAYHLTKRNFRDIIVLEKDKLGSGTTFHSPGLVSAAHPAHRFKPILARSVDLYSRLEEETGEKVEFSRSGTLRLATNSTRMNEFRRYVARDYFQKGDVCKTSLIDANEVQKLTNIVDTSKVLGALYTTGDGYVNTEALTRALAKGAEAGGAKIIENCSSFTLTEQSNGDWIVRFENGSEIRTINIVNAAGLWAVEVAKLTNYDLPLTFVEHQFVGNLEYLPAIVDHDSTFYIRKDGDHLFFGGFEPRASDVVIREDWHEATLEPCFERLSAAYGRACELIPCLNGSPVDARACGVTITADGYPLVGPTNERQNYWLQVGYFDGISSCGGMGKYLADWIVDREPPSELFDTEASRFNRWATRKFIKEKSQETYSMFYNWSYVNRLAGRPSERVSGIYARLAKQGGIFTFRNGWEVAETFPVDDESPASAVIREYQMVTNKCGITDLSWKSKIEVRGADSVDFLYHLLTNQVPKLGTISSGLMLTTNGNILAPLKVFHHDQFRTEFILLTDPERESRDIDWMKRVAAERRANVDISAVGEYLASVALVGPCSREVLQNLTITDVSDKSFGERSTRLIRIQNVPVLAARTSTTMGQLSYEFFHNKAGKQFGIVNFGQATHNMLRIEHGFKLWGRELTLDTNPFECGLEHLVDITKKDFIGRNALLKIIDTKWKRRLVLIACDPLKDLKDWACVPKGMEVIRRKGEEERIGQITSGTYSVRLNCPLAFAWINSDVTLNDEVYFERLHSYLFIILVLYLCKTAFIFHFFF